MSVDLLVRNASLPDGRTNQTILVKDGTIVEIGTDLEGEADRTLDAAGYLVSPPFVDPHFHLDSALTLGIPRLNQSGTLLEGIALWGELRSTLTQEAIVDRALRYCDLAVAQGLLAIRSHVDITDPRLLGIDALLHVRDAVRSYIDLQLVAFPQDGYLRSAHSAENMTRALDKGTEIVGGIPHFERTMEDGAASVKALCRLAADRGLMVDLHCDETDDPLSRHVETLAATTIRFGLQGRVVASHVTSMHSMDNYYASKLITCIAEARLHVVANPLINITLQGRQDTYPKRRGLTRVPELLAGNVNVAFGHDCVMDPWYALGSADMLEVASMAVHLAQMTSPEAIRLCFDAITTNAAQAIGLTDYGLATGCKADFVLLQARDPGEAIRLRASRLAVVRGGKIIARSDPKVSSLSIEHRPEKVTFGTM